MLQLVIAFISSVFLGNEKKKTKTNTKKHFPDSTVTRFL